MAFTYTGENVQDPPVYKTPPEGDYSVQIIKGEEKISRSGKNMIVLTLKIQHPEYHNEILYYIVDGEYIQQKLFNVMNSCGMTFTKGMNVTAQSFVNRKGNIKVKHELYNNEVTLKVAKWLKPSTAPVIAGVDPAMGPATTTNAATTNADGIPF